MLNLPTLVYKNIGNTATTKIQLRKMTLKLQLTKQIDMLANINKCKVSNNKQKIDEEKNKQMRSRTLAD